MSRHSYSKRRKSKKKSSYNLRSRCDGESCDEDFDMHRHGERSHPSSESSSSSSSRRQSAPRRRRRPSTSTVARRRPSTSTVARRRSNSHRRRATTRPSRRSSSRRTSSSRSSTRRYQVKKSTRRSGQSLASRQASCDDLHVSFNMSANTVTFFSSSSPAITTSRSRSPVGGTSSAVRDDRHEFFAMFEEDEQISRLETTPKEHLIIEGPVDAIHNVELLIKNVGGLKPIAWYVKTSRRGHFEANPSGGIIRPGVTTRVNMKFAGGSNLPNPTDRVEVLWTEVEADDAFDRQLFLVDDDILLQKKMLPILYRN